VKRLARRGGQLVLCVLLLCSSACASIRWPFTHLFTTHPTGLRHGFTLEELSGELDAYAARFAALVNNTADDIRDATRDRVIRRRSLVWKLQMPPLLEEVAYGDSPLFAYAATMLVAIAQQRYLTKGDGRDLFGPHQQLAVDAANQLVDDILGVGDRFLSKKEIEEVHARMSEFAEKYPIQGRDFSVQRIPRAIVAKEASQSIGWLLTLPLAPFTALQGVDTGAAAIRDFNRTAKEFTEVVKRMPERVRGQLELFTYDLEDRETVQRTVEALDRTASSAERASTAVAQLPEDLRRTLDESQARLDAVGRVVEQMQAVATPLAETATQLQQGSAAWLAILGPKETTPNPNPNARPFDVRDWQNAAESIGTAAAQLRGLATDLQNASNANALNAAIDRAFWRGVALVVVFFVGLLAYRLAVARLAVRRGA
jgi:hypothetical protein